MYNRYINRYPSSSSSSSSDSQIDTAIEEAKKFVPKPLSARTKYRGRRPRLAKKFPTEMAISDIKHYFVNGNAAIQALIQAILKKYIVDNRPGSGEEASVHEKVMNIVHYADAITVVEIVQEITDGIDKDPDKNKFT